MKKILAITALLLLGIFLFGCTGGGQQATAQPTVPSSGTSQPTQQLQPSQEAAASEQPIVSEPSSGEEEFTYSGVQASGFNTPSGGVSPDDFCGMNEKSKAFLQFLNSESKQASFKPIVSASMTEGTRGYNGCEFFSSGFLWNVEIAFWEEFYEVGCKGTIPEENAPVEIAEIPKACFYSQKDTQNQDMYFIKFVKKNVWVTVYEPYIPQEQISNLKSLAKAVYDKI